MRKERGTGEVRPTVVHEFEKHCGQKHLEVSLSDWSFSWPQPSAGCWNKDLQVDRKLSPLFGPWSIRPSITPSDTRLTWNRDMFAKVSLIFSAIKLCAIELGLIWKARIGCVYHWQSNLNVLPLRAYKLPFLHVFRSKSTGSMKWNTQLKLIKSTCSAEQGKWYPIQNWTLIWISHVSWKSFAMQVVPWLRDHQMVTRTKTRWTTTLSNSQLGCTHFHVSLCYQRSLRRTAQCVYVVYLNRCFPFQMDPINFILANCSRIKTLPATWIRSMKVCNLWSGERLWHSRLAERLEVHHLTQSLWAETLKGGLLTGIEWNLDKLKSHFQSGTKSVFDPGTPQPRKPIRF